jgi:perosamine synthetase
MLGERFMTPSSSLPALLGGPPAIPEGPPAWPHADEDVFGALQAAYRDGSWGQYHGGNVKRLEACLGDYFGMEYALTCASGTVAVELALRALRIGSGDEVILAAYDYPGNFLSVHAVGAQPVLVDVDPDNWNLTPGNLEAAIGPATRAVIASHLHGGLVPMRDLVELAKSRGLGVIEDAAQCPGAEVQGRIAGTWGDVGILSFGGSKLLSAGRGGAVLTSRPDLQHRIRIWVNRGNHVCPLSELQAAVLVPQLKKLDAQNARRAESVRILKESLRQIPGCRPFANRDAVGRPAYYKVGMQFNAASFGLPRAKFLAAARAEGVALDEGFASLHRGRSARRFRSGGPLTVASRAHDEAVVLHTPSCWAQRTTSRKSAKPSPRYRLTRRCSSKSGIEKKEGRSVLVPRLCLRTHFLEGSAFRVRGNLDVAARARREAEPRMQCVPRPSLGTRGCYLLTSDPYQYI